jgi:hypothetical protein
MARIATAALLLVALVGVARALEVTDQVYIYEVYYNAAGPDASNEYIEIINSGPITAYLDGAVITDEGDDGGYSEGVFRFPGVPGGTSIPFEAGDILLIAVDATLDGVPPELNYADWEFFHPSDNVNNPGVPDLTICGGSGDYDIALANGGDGIIIATGVDTTAAIDCETVVDGVNWSEFVDPVPISSTVCVDPDTDSGSATGEAIGRCPDFIDHNVNSEDDWFPMVITPDDVNVPVAPGDCEGTSVRALNPLSWGTIKALYRP